MQKVSKYQKLAVVNTKNEYGELTQKDKNLQIFWVCPGSALVTRLLHERTYSSCF